MKVCELIALLSSLDNSREVVLEDLNGLHWEMEPSLVRIEGGVVVLGAKDINES
jgi:hypothetical protein